MTKRVASGVIITRTSAPPSVRRRMTSIALYPAIPPLIPTTTRRPCNRPPVIPVSGGARAGGDHGQDLARRLVDIAVADDVLVVLGQAELDQRFLLPNREGRGRLGVATGQPVEQFIRRRWRDEDEKAVGLPLPDEGCSLHVDLENDVLAPVERLLHAAARRPVIVVINLG